MSAGGNGNLPRVFGKGWVKRKRYSEETNITYRYEGSEVVERHIVYVMKANAAYKTKATFNVIQIDSAE